MVRQFTFAETAQERDNEDIQELMEQTRTCLDIAFNNVEYMLGNAEFDTNSTEYQKMELTYHHLLKLNQAVNSDNYDEMTRK